MSGGGHWGGSENFDFSEEKHETGYCLELWSYKAVKTPIRRGKDDCFVYEWVDSLNMIERLTVPQAEALAESLKLWAETMREGGHYKEYEEV